MGITSAWLIVRRPSLWIASSTSSLVNLFNNDEPAAFGWTALISPERPIPCERNEWRRATKEE